MVFTHLKKIGYQGKRMRTRQEKRSRRQFWLSVIFAVFLIAFVVSLILFLRSYHTSKEEAQAFEELAELTSCNEIYPSK